MPIHTETAMNPSHSIVAFHSTGRCEEHKPTHMFAVYRVVVQTQIQPHVVKPAYSSHSREQVMTFFARLWSLDTGVLVSLRWSMGQPTVVTIDRWSLYTSGLVSCILHVSAEWHPSTYLN